MIGTFLNIVINPFLLLIDFTTTHYTAEQTSFVYTELASHLV